MSGDPAHSTRLVALDTGRLGERVFVVSASLADNARIWVQGSNRPPRILTGPADAQMTCIAVAPNGRFNAGGYTNGALVLWDSNDGRRLRTLGQIDSENPIGVSAIVF